jgi:hypothetical protein
VHCEHVLPGILTNLAVLGLDVGSSLQSGEEYWISGAPIQVVLVSVS